MQTARPASAAGRRRPACGPGTVVLLAAADEDRGLVVERGVGAVQREPAGRSRRATPGRVGWPAHRDPARVQRVRVEVVAAADGRRVRAVPAGAGRPPARRARRPASRRPTRPGRGRSRGRARGTRACMPAGRVPSSTIHQEPSGASTRSAWPVFWIGRSVLRWLRIGLAGQPSHGPVGRRAAGDRDGVAALGAALGDQQVPVPSRSIQVRRLRVLQPGARTRSARGRRAPRPVAASMRHRAMPWPREKWTQQLPSSSQARSGSMPATSTTTGRTTGRPGPRR